MKRRNRRKISENQRKCSHQSKATAKNEEEMTTKWRLRRKSASGPSIILHNNQSIDIYNVPTYSPTAEKWENRENEMAPAESEENLKWRENIYQWRKINREAHTASAEIIETSAAEIINRYRKPHQQTLAKCFRNLEMKENENEISIEINGGHQRKWCDDDNEKRILPINQRKKKRHRNLRNHRLHIEEIIEEEVAWNNHRNVMFEK